jgi:sec-independent protein translocase protein TatA
VSVIGIIPGLTGPGEVLVIVVVILVLFFGAKKLPEIARSMGKSVNEFKKGREESGKAEAAEAPAEEKDSDEPGAA